MELRAYQEEMIARLQKAWRRVNHVMMQMPTGTGKTVVIGEVIKREELAGARVLVVAHRRELIEQIRETISAFGIPDERVAVESIQRLSRHIGEVAYEPSLVIIDEAHHAQAKTYRMLWERWPKARFLGLTATPCRMGGQGFTELFDTLLQSQRISKFIEQGWLSDFEYISVSPDNAVMRQVGGLTKRGTDGDYQTKEMTLVLDVPESIERLYDSYARFARGKKGIVYAIDKAHAQHIAEYYEGQGVRCCWIEARTPAEERRKRVEDYRQGRLDVIVNVDIFSEGFDCPEVEFIQLARPTLSLSKYLQQVGRGMRVSAGKPHVLILDNVGLYQTFGLPTVDRDWPQMFLGQEAGKGVPGLSRCVVVDDHAEKELMDAQMVRIKRVGEKGTGLEVFLQNGFYGVMRNGKITCPAKFKRVERLQKDCGFFALGVYLSRNEQNYGRLEEVTTVIDKKGLDLRVRLYGLVQWRNGYFYGELNGGNYLLENSWDPVGNSYYNTDPNFTKVAGVEIGFANEHHSGNVLCMKLRCSTGRVSPRFFVWEMLYNRDIIVARDYLVVKKDHNHSYRIRGYLDDGILVESDEQFGYQQIMPDGRKGAFFRTLPTGTTRIMDQRRLGLKRAK